MPTCLNFGAALDTLSMMIDACMAAIICGDPGLEGVWRGLPYLLVGLYYIAAFGLLTLLPQYLGKDKGSPHLKSYPGATSVRKSRLLSPG